MIVLVGPEADLVHFVRLALSDICKSMPKPLALESLLVVQNWAKRVKDSPPEGCQEERGVPAKVGEKACQIEEEHQE